MKFICILLLSGCTVSLPSRPVVELTPIAVSAPAACPGQYAFTVTFDRVVWPLTCFGMDE